MFKSKVLRVRRIVQLRNFVIYFFGAGKVSLQIWHLLNTELFSLNGKRFRAKWDIVKHMPDYLINSTSPINSRAIVDFSPLDLDFEEKNRTLHIANEKYQSGDWAQADSLLKEVAQIHKRAQVRLGSETINLRLIGSEITQSIGHMAVALGPRARFKQMGVTSDNYVVLAGKVANRFYLNLWQSHFPILEVSPLQVEITERTLWPLVESVQQMPVNGMNLNMYRAHNRSIVESEAMGFDPLLRYPDEFMERSHKFLSRYGFKKGDWFVALHVREGNFDKPGYGRNADISTYIDAINEISKRGGYVIRLGDLNSKPLPKMKNLIDLTAGIRPEWLDVFCLSQCVFLIGTTSGPLVVPNTFGVPILATNAPDLKRFAYYPNSLLLPKLVNDLRRDRLLTLQEILDSRAGVSDGWLDAQRHGLSWRANTPGEITSAVIEMLESSHYELTAKQKAIRSLMSSELGPSTPIAETFVQAHPEVFN